MNANKILTSNRSVPTHQQFVRNIPNAGRPAGAVGSGSKFSVARSYSSAMASRFAIPVRGLFFAQSKLSAQKKAALIRGLRSKDWRIRAKSATALGSAGLQSAVPKLAPLLSDPVVKVREAAAEALRNISIWHPIQDKQAIHALKNALTSKSSKMRASAIGALSYRRELAYVPLFLPLFTDHSDKVKEAAAYGIMRISDKHLVRDRRVIPALIKLSKNKASVDVREAAVVTMGSISQSHGVVMRFRLRKTPTKAPSSLRKMFHASKSYYLSVVPQLVYALGDSSFRVRLRACEALRRIGDHRAASPLAKVFKNSREHIWVRQAAARALGVLPCTASANALVPTLKNAKANKTLRRLSAEGLGNFEWPGAVTPLIGALADRDKGVKKAAIDALRKYMNSRRIGATDKARIAKAFKAHRIP